VEVCAKFGGDWSGGSGVKRGHRYKQLLLYIFRCWVKKEILLLLINDIT